jgi:copper chaperone CopZ
VRASLKGVPGVDTVDVSLEKGLASLKMKPGNAATFRQLQDAIAKNGFTMKSSNLKVAGRIVSVNGHSQFQVSVSNELVNLLPETPQVAKIDAMSGKLVLVDGMLEEAAKGKTPDTIRYRSITEER